MYSLKTKNYLYISLTLTFFSHSNNLLPLKSHNSENISLLRYLSQKKRTIKMICLQHLCDSEEKKKKKKIPEKEFV